MFDLDSSVGKESTCKAGNPGLIPGSGGSPVEGKGYPLQYCWGSLVAQLVKNPPAVWETWIQSWVGKIPWRRERLPTPVSWPGESHGLYSPWGCKELDMTERLSLLGLDWCVLSGDSARFGVEPMPGPTEKSRILGEFTC